MILYKIYIYLDSSEFYFQNKTNATNFLKTFYKTEMPGLNNPKLKFKDFCELYGIDVEKIQTED